MPAQQIEIPVAVRSEVGKSAARRLRAAGKIPAVLYGRGIASVPLSVDAAALSRALEGTAWGATLLRLRIEGDDIEDPSPSVMIAEVQREPARGRLLSIDFRRISLAEKVHTSVPVVHINQSPGVKLGGILEHLAHELSVECLPTDIPDHLEADISGLGIGDVLRVSDLTPPPEVRLLAAPDDVVIVVAPPVQLEEVAAPAEVEEGAVVAETEEPEVIQERETEE